MHRDTQHDQASGLRELFAPAAPPQFHALSCPRREAIVLPIAQVLAHAMVERGFNIAWIDEFDLSMRQDWPLPCPVRFDLSQSLMNHVPLASGLQSLNPHLWYALSRRLSRVPAKVFPTLMQRLQDSGIVFDRVLLCLASSTGRLLHHYHDAIHHTVLTACAEVDLMQTRDWMVKVQSQQRAASWSVVLVGGDTDHSAFARLADSVEPLLGQSVQLLGHVSSQFPQGALASAWEQPLELRDLILTRLCQR
jgi:hypothetical protein